MEGLAQFIIHRVEPLTYTSMDHIYFLDELKYKRKMTEHVKKNSITLTGKIDKGGKSSMFAFDKFSNRDVTFIPAVPKYVGQRKVYKFSELLKNLFSDFIYVEIGPIFGNTYTNEFGQYI